MLVHQFESLVQKFDQSILGDGVEGDNGSDGGCEAHGASEDRKNRCVGAGLGERRSSVFLIRDVLLFTRNLPSFANSLNAKGEPISLTSQ